MNNDLQNLKKEVASSKSIASEEREEILSDLRYLEESNKKYAQMKLDEINLNYRKQKNLVIFCFLLGLFFISYISYKFW